ncbi:MAG TPA: hypothetical protein VK553_09110 [Candidatus Nitrosopolaris rasttigaisensis]|nr:hypothetical protein [Candidatus Nitrosopolaris rasttigaisensis]
MSQNLHETDLLFDFWKNIVFNYDDWYTLVVLGVYFISATIFLACSISILTNDSQNLSHKFSQTMTNFLGKENYGSLKAG